jgi:hypothetical protein
MYGVLIYDYDKKIPIYSKINEKEKQKKRIEKLQISVFSLINNFIAHSVV